MITDNIDGAEIINEQTVNKLGVERNSVICFLSCAHIEGLIESFKTYLSGLPKEPNQE